MPKRSRHPKATAWLDVSDQIQTVIENMRAIGLLGGLVR
jgi:hypothetical protein